MSDFGHAYALETLILSLHTRGCRPLEFYDLHYAENRERAIFMFDEDLFASDTACVLYPSDDDCGHCIYARAKGHTIDITVTCPLLKRLCAALDLKSGERVFTPQAHGYRKSRAANPTQFDSATFSEYFKSLTG